MQADVMLANKLLEPNPIQNWDASGSRCIAIPATSRRWLSFLQPH
jgi:hypothetical protein